ncbi:MAG: VWA domain-containing protein, partial [Hydrogenophaga sp.]|nr:VWA domain-containing protein [Hydrogenophaga sp.]
RYVNAAVTLHSLGRGMALVDAWIGAAPQVAREVGEDAAQELATAALALASRTSGTVIEQVLATAPTAARRLADAALFQQYLQFLGTLAAQAPRGLRPMLGQLETLFAQLTLGGLRRWALWGAQAHRTQYPEQVAYFGLASRESLAMLQNERKGTLLVDVQRRLQMYLRALWARDFFMRPTAVEPDAQQEGRPFIEGGCIHLPDAYDPHAGSEGPVAAMERYRAAAAHAAAHLVFTRQPMSTEGLSTWQMALVGLLEDARVEALAMARFPGLLPLWARLHTARADQAASAGDWLGRLARALLDPGFADPHPWITEGRALWAQALPNVLAQPHDNTVSRNLGVHLAHRYRDSTRGPAFQARNGMQSAAYRDDNRHVWAFRGFDVDGAGAASPAPHRQRRKTVNLMEFVNELDVEGAGDDAQEVWVLGTELFPYEDLGVSFNDSEGREPVSAPVHYPEWDHQIQLERPAWVTVQEHRPRLGDGALIDAILAEHRPLVNRMRRVLDALQPQGVQRIRKLEDGDEIDLDAAITGWTDRLQGRQPDPRTMVRHQRHTRDISVLVLLDLSASANDAVRGAPGANAEAPAPTVLDLTRTACALLADSLQRLGDPFALHGFCSDGRHDVQYRRFKDFGQPYGALARARLAGMGGALSTRMGAAIRHATAALQGQPSRQRLMLVITDGEPADVDERDPAHLRHDARKAVEAAQRAGVTPFCISLDPQADAYVSRIFGARQYTVVDRVERLPEKLPMLYAALTR